MKLLTTFTAAATMLLMAACSGNQVEDIDPEYFPVKLDGEKSWGMMSPEGDILYGSEFKNCPSAVFNGIFMVEEKDGYSLYYADDKPRLVPGCDKLISAGIFAADEYAPIVRKGKRITVINRDGEEMFTLSPQKGKEIIWSAEAFTDGMLLVKNEDGKFGAFNHEGELTVPCKYDNINLFNDGYAIGVTYDEKDDDKRKAEIIDHDGNVIVSIKNFKFTASQFYDGKCAIKIDDERYGFVTTDGDVVKCPKDVNSIMHFDGKQFIYSDEDDYDGLMEYNEDGGEIIIKAGKYKNLTPLNKSWSKFLAYMGDGEYRIINRDGETEVKLEDFKEVSVLSQSASTLLVRDGSSYTVLNDEGEIINRKLDIESFNEFHFPTIVSDLAKARDAVERNGYYINHDFGDYDEANQEQQMLPTEEEVEEEEVVAPAASVADYNYYSSDDYYDPYSSASEYDSYPETSAAASASVPEYWDK